MNNRLKTLYEELAKLTGYELLPYGKMIRARERVRILKDEINQLKPKNEKEKL